jgi:tubulin beta
LFFDSVAVLALASCNEHVAEASVSRPHPPTPRVLYTVPTQSSKLERSEKKLNFLVRETCAHYLHFFVPGPTCHTEFLTFSLLRALFLPRAPHLQAAFSRKIVHLQTGQCGCQMGTKLKGVLCDEHGIGGSDEYFDNNDAYLDIINVFYNDASGSKYLPRAVLFDLEPGVIYAVRASPLGCLICPGINLVGKTGLKTTTKELSTNSSAPPHTHPEV